MKISLAAVTCVLSLGTLGCSTADSEPTAESECKSEAMKMENRQLVNAMGKEEYIKMCIQSVEKLCKSGAFDC